MASQPVDDRGVHELILKVFRAGDRFCYRYQFDGMEQHRAPIIVVRPGETFAVRVVNELDGPAPGAAMAASALPACRPATMMSPMSPPHRYMGYMNHVILARPMPRMRDIDVNMHFHGFRGSPVQDDVFLSTLSTPQHACEYVLTVPKTQPPGTYFYHPHAHGMADDQVAGGLAGAWIVEPPAPEIPASDDHVVIIRYRVPFVGNDGFLPDTTPLFFAAAAHIAALKPAPPVHFDPFNPPPWPSSFPLRAGNTRIVDPCGSRESAKLAVDGVDAPATLTVPAGEPQLLRVLNATSDTIEYLQLRDSSGKAEPLHIVARDGVPVGGDDLHPLSRYVAANEDPLPVASRVDLLLTPQLGQTLTLFTAHGCNAPFDEFTLPADLLVLHAGPPASDPTMIASAPLDEQDNPAVKLLAYAREHPNLIHRRAFTYSEYVFPKPHGHLDDEYYLTQTSVPNFHEQPFWPVYRNGSGFPVASVVVKRGTIEEWYLYNTTTEVHSFHIHQMAFVDEDDGGDPAVVDTAIVPFGTMLPDPKDPAYPLIKPSLTRVLLDFRHVRRGTFVFHCHMLFHEDHGMMGVIRVE